MGRKRKETKLSNKILLEINNPHLDSYRKYQKAVIELKKAFHFKQAVPEKKNEDHSVFKEKSVYPSVNEMMEDLNRKMDHRFYKVYQALIHKFMRIKKSLNDDLPFELAGETFINPKTGLPLTNTEWEEIQLAIKDLFSWAFDGISETLTREAIALGMILQDMDPLVASQTSLNNVSLSNPDFSHLQSQYVLFAQQSSASHIVELTDMAREKIKQTIIDAQRSKWDASKLEAQLFDNFGDFNRDWRRVSTTELQTNIQTGFLVEEIEKAAKDKREFPFVRGISNGNACEECLRLIDGKVFVVLDNEPPSWDGVFVNGKKYHAMWPGKSNIGRLRKDWWVCIPLHPNCHCSLVSVYPGYEDIFDKLHEKMHKEKTSVSYK